MSLLAPGTEVVLLGLLKREDLNGKQGKIVNYNYEAQRYDVEVQLPESKLRVLVREDNLEVVANFGGDVLLRTEPLEGVQVADIPTYTPTPSVKLPVDYNSAPVPCCSEPSEFSGEQQSWVDVDLSSPVAYKQPRPPDVDRQTKPSLTHSQNGEADARRQPWPWEAPKQEIPARSFSEPSLSPSDEWTTPIDIDPNLTSAEQAANGSSSSATSDNFSQTVEGMKARVDEVLNSEDFQVFKANVSQRVDAATKTMNEKLEDAKKQTEPHRKHISAEFERARMEINESLQSPEFQEFKQSINNKLTEAGESIKSFFSS